MYFFDLSSSNLVGCWAETHWPRCTHLAYNRPSCTVLLLVRLFHDGTESTVKYLKQTFNVSPQGSRRRSTVVPKGRGKALCRTTDKAARVTERPGRPSLLLFSLLLARVWDGINWSKSSEKRRLRGKVWSSVCPIGCWTLLLCRAMHDEKLARA